MFTTHFNNESQETLDLLFLIAFGIVCFYTGHLCREVRTPRNNRLEVPPRYEQL